MDTAVRVYVLNPTTDMAKALCDAFDRSTPQNIVIDLENQTVASVQPLARLMGAIASKRPVEVPSAYCELTARELEVAKLIREGKCNKGIAAELTISERTVECHISSIFSKLAVNSRVQLAMHPYFNQA